MKRLEGLSKLTGAEQYVDDLPLDGHLWGMTVRSPAARGRLREVRFGDGVDWSQFVIVDHGDIPGPNEIRMIDTDMPVLVSDHIRYLHEPVVLLAHASREAVRRAVREVELVVEPAHPVLDFTAPPTPRQIQHGPDNVLKELRIAKGDVEAALAAAPHVIEGVYETGAQEHVYLETQGVVAWMDGDVVVVKGSMQCPYYVLAALTWALSRDESQVRVIQAPTGGGFGGKEDYPSVLAAHAALLALKSGKPVKMVYDRSEDMAATTKRHPSRVRHRTGVDNDGRLLAQDIEVVLDGGAYVTLTPVVLSRAILHAAGPYSCEAVRIAGKAILTNAVPFGAFRGFGAPQTHFANERHMDVIAHKLGLDPAAVRKVNLIRDGESTSTGQIIDDGTDRLAVLQSALDASDYAEKKILHAEFNAHHPYLRRGIGLATFHHGAGFTGSGEVYLESVVRVSALPDGRVEVLSAAAEMGQGALTVLAQIAAARLDLAPEEIIVAEPDTFRVPNSGPTVASRTAMIVGRLIERACDALRDKLDLPSIADGDELRAAIASWHEDNHGPLQAEAQYEPPPGIEWNEDTYVGDAYGSYAWATYVADVEVDLRTYITRVTDFVAVQEIGKVLNETLATGQIQGGVVQAIGWALTEECKFRDGAMSNNQLTNYAIPTAADVPSIRVTFLETPYPYGAQGCKGIGELPMDGPAPAVANAVAAALGIEPRSVPLTPERLMELVSDEGAATVAGLSGAVGDDADHPEGPATGSADCGGADAAPLPTTGTAGESSYAAHPATPFELDFTLNGQRVSLGVDPQSRLLDILRYQLGRTGTKEGCGEGECGACTVLLDDLPVNSCLVPAYQVRGRDVVTVESTDPGAVDPLHTAGTTQCGACTPGVVMTARWIRDHPELLERFPARRLMAGNLCRCTGYDGIINGLSGLMDDEEGRE